MKRDIDYLIKRGVNITELSKGSNYYRGGGCIRYLATPSKMSDLVAVANVYQQSDIPIAIIGRLSNTLITDDDYLGLAVSTNGLRGEFYMDGDSVYLGAGEYLPTIGSRCIQKGLDGLQNLSTIPSSIGAAVYGNVGCYGASISDVISSAYVYSFDSAKTVQVTKDNLDVGYRSTRLRANTDLVCAVKLQLKLEDKEVLLAQKAECIAKRKQFQPLEPSLGSVFKNPMGYSAGWLIEQVGLMSHTIGGAKISPKHANFIVNIGGGSTRDYLELMELCINNVYKQFSIELIPEVKLLK